MRLNEEMGWQSSLYSSPPLFSPAIPPFPLLSLPLPFNPARGYGERCKLPQLDLEQSLPTEIDLSAF